MKEQRYQALFLENQLCFPLYACAKEITRQYRPFLDRYSLTYTQYIALLALWEYGPMHLEELGEKLMLDSGTLTPLLKKLETKGYLRREKDPLDKRNLLLSVTEEGFAFREEALKIPGQIGNCLHLSKEEAITLYKLLYKTINNMKEDA